MKSIRFNDYDIEIIKKYGMSHPHPDYWDAKKIIIYSESADLDESAQKYIVQYLYDEGFIEDRRMEVEIKKNKI